MISLKCPWNKTTLNKEIIEKIYQEELTQNNRQVFKKHAESLETFFRKAAVLCLLSFLHISVLKFSIS